MKEKSYSVMYPESSESLFAQNGSVLLTEVGTETEEVVEAEVE